MSQESELAHAELTHVREQVGILAEQVGRLLDVVACQDARGDDKRLAQHKLAVLESLMWKLHARHNRLKASVVGFGPVDPRKLN